MIRLLALLAALILLISAPTARAQSAEANVEALLAADRAFAAAAAAAATPVDALAAMFDADIVTSAGTSLAVGREATLTPFRAAHTWQSGTVTWRPIRGGVSADGTQGFTYGFLTLSGGDPARRERKYLAYWVRRAEGWRVVAWRQTPRAAGEAASGMEAPSLPAATVAPNPDPAVTARHQASLAAAEQAFSDRAQAVGLRTAFREFGRADAVNLGGGPDFIRGPEAISHAVDSSGEATSPVRWSTERSFVASSGDLGVSLGMIHRNAAPADGGPASFAFFTVWKRDTPDGPWRYIAE